MKTPEQIAEEYKLVNESCCDDCAYNDFLAGYKAAETAVTFTRQPREMFRIVYTEDGFDIKIPDDVTMTDAAQEFVRIVMENNRFTAHKTAEIE